MTLSGMPIAGGTAGDVVNEGTLTAENLFVWKNTGQGGIFNTNVASLSTTKPTASDRC